MSEVKKGVNGWQIVADVMGEIDPAEMIKNNPEKAEELIQSVANKLEKKAPAAGPFIDMVAKKSVIENASKLAPEHVMNEIAKKHIGED